MDNVLDFFDSPTKVLFPQLAIAALIARIIVIVFALITFFTFVTGHTTVALVFFVLSVIAGSVTYLLEYV